MFTRLLFLCILFPVSLFFYHILPQRFRKIVLLLTSLLVLGLLQQARSFLFLMLIFFSYFCGRQMGYLRTQTLGAKLLLLGHDSLYVGALLLLRPPVELDLLGASLYPIGISMLALQNISYLHQVYRREIRPERVFYSFLLYSCFYPKIPFGAFFSYSAFQKMQQRLQCSVVQVGKGLGTLTIGLAKYTLLGGQLSILATQMQAASTGTDTVFFTWLYLLILFLLVYFQVTGYTDMASGIAACYGYVLPEQSRLPLLNGRFSAIARNWHPTIVKWFQNLLGVSREKGVGTAVRLLVAWGVCGWFFRGQLTSLLWGLWVGICLLTEWLLLWNRKRLPNSVGWLLTIIAWMTGWCFFCSDTVSEALLLVGRMFGSSGDLGKRTDFYFLQSGFRLLLICLFFVLGYAASVSRWLRQKRMISLCMDILTPLLHVLLLCLSIAAIVSGNVQESFLQW